MSQSGCQRGWQNFNFSLGQILKSHIVTIAKSDVKAVDKRKIEEILQETSNQADLRISFRTYRFVWNVVSDDENRGETSKLIIRRVPDLLHWKEFRLTVTMGILGRSMLAISIAKFMAQCFKEKSVPERVVLLRRVL